VEGRTKAPDRGKSHGNIREETAQVTKERSKFASWSADRHPPWGKGEVLRSEAAHLGRVQGIHPEKKGGWGKETKGEESRRGQTERKLGGEGDD